jgi:hypothetical protein
MGRMVHDGGALCRVRLSPHPLHKVLSDHFHLGDGKRRSGKRQSSLTIKYDLKVIIWLCRHSQLFRDTNRVKVVTGGNTKMIKKIHPKPWEGSIDP